MATTLKENLNNAKQFLFYKASKILARGTIEILKNEKQEIY